MTNMRPPNKTILLKVVILGDGGVGKSCLMNRFVSNRFDENSFHTIGVEFMNKDIEVDGVKYTLQIWDTAGQERFRALRTPFYRGSDICLLAYAIDDRDSFRGLKQWREEFLKYADVKPDNFPFIVVGNKNDIGPQFRQITLEEVSSWCQEYHISSFIETSSKNAINVTEAFMLAVKQWQRLEKSTERELRAQGDTIDLTTGVRLQHSNSKFCCGGGGGIGSRSNSPAISRDDF
ncbi:ras-related protein Rab-9B [Condylostylus longicornis]|uniref:ras-related protein Rab-9B n=1 Tax=Condylostylus longicornis TaxID=2530218 RepID=UPI00244E411D|nr:ras-related protein Rab-9B [Condylostylus longicornis]